MLSSLGNGQSLEDKLYAVKYFISGQTLSLVVLKATTTEVLGPKKKHLNYLVNLTNEPNVSIPHLVKYLMQRARHPEWSVAFKAVITIHYLTSFGNEKFIQNLASSTVNKRSFDYLSSFVDRTSTQAFDMSTFIRRYSRYLNTKIQTYRSLGMDFCKIIIANGGSGGANGRGDKSLLRIRSMQLEQLMGALPKLQNQFDSLVAFDASTRDLNNGIINSAFSMLYKDFVKLYIVYQAAIIRLLELYFMVDQLKRAQEMVEAYKKFLIRMEKVSDFMRVIDSIGMDKIDMPNVSRSPKAESLSLKSLERHLRELEGGSKRASRGKLPAMSKMQSVELLPKLDYGTLERRRSLKLAARGGGNALVRGSPERLRKTPLVDYVAAGGGSKRLPGNLDELSEEMVMTTTTEKTTDKLQRDCDFASLDPLTSSLPARETSTSNGAPAASSPFSTRASDDFLLTLGFDKVSVENGARTTQENVEKNEEERDLMIVDDTDDSEQMTTSKTTTTTTTTTAMAATPGNWVQVEL